jgi:hypothetical protein
MRMSYSVAPAPGPRTRPGVVATASVLLYVSAVLLLVSTGVSLVPIGDMQKIINDQYANEPENVRQAASIGAVVGPIVVGVVYVLIAVGLIVLGIFVGKGKQPARVITWVLAGLSVLCLGCGLASSAVSTSFSGLGGGADQEALLKAIADATPGWVTAAALVLQIISLLVMITVIILLALPAANDYFRKEQQVWVPPTAPWPADPNNFPPPPPPGAKL